MNSTNEDTRVRRRKNSKSTITNEDELEVLHLLYNDLSSAPLEEKEAGSEEIGKKNVERDDEESETKEED